MIEINLSLLIQMANFLVFLLLMNLVLYRPIRRIVAERKKMMAEKQEGIERLEVEATSAVQEYDRKIQESRRSGLQRIQELKTAAYDEEKQLLQKISEEAAAQVQKMRAQIQKDISVARDQLREQVKSFSVQLAQKILGRSI